MNIVLAASEAVPYAKTGGLADVLGALPHELSRLGHRVTLILPGYRAFIAESRARQALARFHIPTSGASVQVVVEEETAAATEGLHPIRVLIVRYDPYFDRAGLYQDDRGDYSDNLDRFALFCRAILETIEYLCGVRGETVDLLHLHDWQTALCSVYLKSFPKKYTRLQNLKTLMTLHNVGYQGVFPGSQFPKTGLPSTLLSPTGVEFYGSINCLKGGIIFSDAVSTVSPTYAKEILTPEFGCGLEGVLQGRADGVHGITNGIDTSVWDPKSDTYLPAHYAAKNLAGKQVCKRALQHELSLPDRTVPILALIGRLTPQKGFDLLTAIIPELMLLDIQIVLLGTGDRDLEQQFQAARARFPKQIGLSVGFHEGLAHRIEAGADMLIMPSRYEPCGLSQLYSLRYGTIPLVRRTGGLADTVVPFRPSTVEAQTATGFQFIEASPDSLLSTILLALQVYKEKEVWHSLIQAGMKTDVSWTHAASQYVELYRAVADGKKAAIKGF